MSVNRRVTLSVKHFQYSLWKAWKHIFFLFFFSQLNFLGLMAFFSDADMCYYIGIVN